MATNKMERCSTDAATLSTCHRFEGSGGTEPCPFGALSVGTTCSVQLVSAPSPRDLGVRRSADLPRILAKVCFTSGDYTPSTQGKGMASIFSAPLPVTQERIVAFAPSWTGWTTAIGPS